MHLHDYKMCLIFIVEFIFLFHYIIYVICIQLNCLLLPKIEIHNSEER